jgi:hypothetical protein
MIKSVALKFGSSPGVPPLSFNVTPITVFVGPNNSGKSKVLSELQQWFSEPQPRGNDRIVENVTFGIDQARLDEVIEAAISPRAAGDDPGLLLIGKRHRRGGLRITREDLQRILADPNGNIRLYCRCFFSDFMLVLDGSSRLELVNEASAGDLNSPPQHVLDTLMRDHSLRRSVQEMIYSAFGFYPVIDHTRLGHLRIRISPRLPLDNAEERSNEPETVAFYKQATPISEFGDGIKAFTGMLLPILAGSPNVILIDEPEAFLHPALAFNLGREASIAAGKEEKRLFVSTHSASFLMGCIQSGVPLNVVRLTYQRGVATARLLPHDRIVHLMRNPLLRSVGVLSGLFHESVIVTEGDADRAFYQEINERLLRYKTASGIPNCLFLNAQNKQTVHQIVRPLRELGIAAAGIVDIDVIKDGGKTWTDHLRAAGMPDLHYSELGGMRSKIFQKCLESGRDAKKDGGTSILGESDRDAANNLFDQLADYGLFVIPGGELEHWLKSLGATGHGPSWLIRVFEAMGENPDKPGYLRPGSGDVWDFIAMVGNWLKNPNRKGIPTGVARASDQLD